MENEKLEKMTISLFNHIRKAKKQALKENIKANCILIDKEVAKLNRFYFDDGNSVTHVPTMILGLKVTYSENLSDELGIDTNFALAELPESRTSLSNYSTDELLEEIRRRFKEIQDA